MEPFLLRVAERMIGEHGTQLHKVAVVLPSARAGLHLRKYLAQVAGSALWSPDIRTWDGFIEGLAGMRRMGDLETLFELYAAHRSTRSAPDDLDAFLAWAPTVLSDINDAEAHLLDLHRFYDDLRALEGIEHWSLGNETLSPGQQRLVQYWQQQGQLHHAFVERLRAANIGTGGTLGRTAVKRVQEDAVMPWTTVWFAGLNAFTTAQQAIVDALVRKGAARLCWDADRAYFDHPVHEAGHFLRKAIARSGEGLIPLSNALRTADRRVEVVELPTAIAMALHAAALLAELTSTERSRTAVLLADETLLLPLLDALPADIGPVNVTMGLRLHDLPTNTLVTVFLELQQQHDASSGYPIVEVERLLRHPFLNQRDSDRGEPLLAAIRKMSAARITHGVLRDAGGDGSAAMKLVLKALEPIGGNTQLIPARLNALFSAASMHVGHLPFEREQLYRMAGMHHGLQAQLARAGVDFAIPAYARLHARLVREQRLAFFGEPLQGLQIMGMLETRAIDHERIIVLSCNEGKLPPASGQRTFVPFDVRSVHGLPLGKDSDALAAYTFHRLMQHATHVHLLFSADAGEAGNGPSRYIAQLEADAVGTNTVIRRAAYHAPLAVRSNAPIVVQKDTAVLERMRALLVKGISPSALGAYIRCPLDFHFRYVLGMKEEDDVGDELGSNVLGTAVHEAMQAVCTPLIGKLLQPDDLRRAAGLLPDLLRERILAQRPHASLDGGHARLQWIMATEAMSRALYIDADDLAAGTEMEYIALEQDFTMELPSARHALGISVLLRGRVDRIELRDGIHRIMDIKTGSVRPEEFQVKSWEPALFDARKEKALQLACYALLFLHADPAIEQVHAGIVPLQKPSFAGRCFLQVNGGSVIHRAALSDIETVLLALVSRMLDPGEAIMHAPDAKHCAFCAGAK